jgi:hypothetical protein
MTGVRIGSRGWALVRVFGSGTLVCSHCGSTELYPNPGLLGELGGVLGRIRYACRDCRRHTWLRLGAEVPPAPPGEPWLEAPKAPDVFASLDALDVDFKPLPPSRSDLRALDAELTRQRRKRRPSSRPRPARG